MEKLVVFQDDPNSPKLAKIANLLGIEHELAREIPEQPSCIILRGEQFDAMQSAMQQSPHSILVYDAPSSRIFSEEFKPFFHPSASIQVSQARPDITTVLSGFNIQWTATEMVFSSCSGFDPLLFADDFPFFLSKDRLFLLGSSKVLDLDSVAECGCEPCREYFTELIPFAMFIRWVFKERCWHLPVYYACIIIDDPLLKRRYGFIDFPKFLTWLRRNDLGATFAFIPWNHSRSDPSITAMFRMNPDRLSICVHGCDHVGGEFGITDAAHLDAIVKTATARMVQHEKSNTLPYDRIMVFPHGKFSSEALEALMRNGYVAAVNTSVFSTNQSEVLTIRDLLDLAVVRSSGVPLFRRRYPVDLFDFACDIFFEKPVLIVQHHQDFRSGFDPLLSFIQRLREIKPNMKWMPLGTVLARSFWQRIEGNGVVGARKLVCKAQAGGGAEMHYGLKERAKIALRRYLCEFRDNHIHRSRLLTSVVKAIRK